MNADGEVVELMTEIVDIKLTRYPITITCSNLVIIGKMVVNLADIVFFREGVADTLDELRLVGMII